MIDEKDNNIIELPLVEVAHDPPAAPVEPSAAIVVRPPVADMLPAVVRDPAALVHGQGKATPHPVTAYLATQSSKASKKTVRGHLRRCCTVVKVPFERMAWTELTAVHTDAIRAALVEHVDPATGKPYSPKTITTTMDALRGILFTCMRLDLITAEQFEKATRWPTLKASRLLAGRELSTVEIEAVNAHCNALTGPYGAFMRALFALLLGAGLRATELGRVRVAGYRREPVGGSIRLIGKGNVEDVVPLGEDEALTIDEWLAARALLEPRSPWLLVRVGPRGTLFEGAMYEMALYRICQHVAEACGIEKFSPHDCRRTFCTSQLRSREHGGAGMPIQHVQRLMRHADVRTTQRYDRTRPEEDAATRQTYRLWKARPKAEPKP
jgi:integrase/recombinase XerD